MPNAPVEKKPVETADWHWKDVLAALYRRGWSMRQVGMAEGYPDGSALGETARRAYPKAEAILARYIGVAHPKEIWPSRYDRNGVPNRRIGPAPMRGVKPMRGQTPVAKATTAPAHCNPQKAVG